MDPFSQLAINENADDAAIKKAYLEQIRLFPPEHHPDQFEQTQKAYQLIKDEAARTKYWLLKVPEFDLPLILQQALPSENKSRPSAAQLINLLENSHSYES